MKQPHIRRRDVLGATGGIAGTAGCLSGSRNTDTTDNTASTSPTDTAAGFDADLATPIEPDDVDELHAGNVNNDLYAKAFPGDDLSHKLQYALGALAGGRGRIVVTPPDDGSTWTWSQDLLIDEKNFEGVELAVRQGVAIEYTGTGWCLTVRGLSSFEGFDRLFSITGGNWISTDDADGWCRLQDSGRTTVAPDFVEFTNASATAVGVSLENHNRWTENCYLTGLYRGDIGIDFKPASVTGGSEGTISFDDLYVEHLKVDNVQNTGIRLRGGFRDSQFNSVTCWLGAEDATGIEVGTSEWEGSTFYNLKVEGGGTPGTTAIETTNSYDPYYTMHIVGSNMVDVAKYVDRASGDHVIVHNHARRGAYQMENMETKGEDTSKGMRLAFDDNTCQLTKLRPVFEYTHRKTMVGDYTLSPEREWLWIMDPNGARRTVGLPAGSDNRDGLFFRIGNLSSAEYPLDITHGDTTLVTIQPGEVGSFASDGQGWAGFSAPGGVT